jgi:hypothetical protein
LIGFRCLTDSFGFAVLLTAPPSSLSMSMLTFLLLFDVPCLSDCVDGVGVPLENGGAGHAGAKFSGTPTKWKFSPANGGGNYGCCNIFMKLLGG